MTAVRSDSSVTAFARHGTADRWHLLGDDEQSFVASSWKKLCRFCNKNRILPEMLFFESEGL